MEGLVFLAGVPTATGLTNAIVINSCDKTITLYSSDLKVIITFNNIPATNSLYITFIDVAAAPYWVAVAVVISMTSFVHH